MPNRASRHHFIRASRCAVVSAPRTVAKEESDTAMRQRHARRFPVMESPRIVPSGRLEMRIDLMGWIPMAALRGLEIFARHIIDVPIAKRDVAARAGVFYAHGGVIASERAGGPVRQACTTIMANRKIIRAR